MHGEKNWGAKGRVPPVSVAIGVATMHHHSQLSDPHETAPLMASDGSVGKNTCC